MVFIYIALGLMGILAVNLSPLSKRIKWILSLCILLVIGPMIALVIAWLPR